MIAEDITAWGSSGGDNDEVVVVVFRVVVVLIVVGTDVLDLPSLSCAMRASAAASSASFSSNCCFNITFSACTPSNVVWRVGMRCCALYCRVSGVIK